MNLKGQIMKAYESRPPVLTEKLGTEAVKLDDNKLRFDLIPPYATKQLARVFTFGAQKYDDNNWMKGFDWSRLMASFERHYQDFKSGIDIDDDSGLYHLAHCMANGFMLLEHYRLHPNLDDRYKPYLKDVKIVLDIDDVVADFAGAYKEKFGEVPQRYWDHTYNMPERLDEITKNKDFYVNLKVKHRPNFTPHAYVSSRSVPVEWTQEFLEKNGLPCRPVHHVPFNTSKVETLKSIGAEVLVDDKFENFKEAQLNGITAFLMDAEHNQHYDVGYRRLYDLDIKNIIR